MKKRLIIVIIMILPFFRLFSADLAQIKGAEGSSFVLIRGGSTYAFDLSLDDVLGMTLYPGDTLMTESETFLEIHFLKGKTKIKIAGQTTVTLERLDHQGGGVLRVGLGRVRVSTKGLPPRGGVYLITETTAMGGKGIEADFGIDYVYQNPKGVDSAEIKTICHQAYVFTGEITAASGLNTEGSNLSEVMNDSLAQVLASQQNFDFGCSGEAGTGNLKEIPDEVYVFWNEHPFQDGTTVASATGKGKKEPPPDRLLWDIPERETSTRYKLNIAGAYTFGVGAGILSLSFLAFIVLPQDLREPTYYFTGFGGGVSLIGTGLIVGSYFVPEEKPPLPENGLR